MSDFLARMSEGSLARAHALRASTDLPALLAAARSAPPVRPLRLDGFDVIAEVKRVSPSQGTLDADGDVVERARAYARGGAAAISVLTEPSAFGGELAHLRAVAAAVDVPAMRKDFLVDPWQVWEARAHGASGVLIVLRIVDDATLGGLLEVCAETGMFALVEAFDAADLARVPSTCARQLVGVNVRDLATLAIDPARLASLAGALPAGFPAVAESGIATPEDAARAARLGYRAALVGTALMNERDPADAVARLRAAGREVACTSG